MDEQLRRIQALVMLAKDAGLESIEVELDTGMTFKAKFPAAPPVIVAPREYVPPAKQGKVENDPSQGERKSMFERALGRPMPTLAETPQ